MKILYVCCLGLYGAFHPIQSVGEENANPGFGDTEGSRLEREEKLVLEKNNIGNLPRCTILNRDTCFICNWINKV